MNFSIQNLASVIFSVHKNAEPQKANQTNQQKFSVSPSNQELLANMNSRQLDGLYARVTQVAKNLMNNMQQNIFLRDMMGLPKDWAGLLKEFATSQNAQVANMINNLNE